LRKEKPSLLLAAGDMVQGNTWSNLFEGKPVIEVMNAMRFDAMVVGNHEFDFGKTVLTERIREANFPVLGANVTGLDVLRPYTVKVVDGIRVGIIGVVTERNPHGHAPPECRRADLHARG
jgi:2',3'-cyclic-nucleotide 2'-phosphodiesterase (5'-nucleotidase family)